MTITITEQRLNQIKKLLAFPIEDGEFLLTDDQIKEFCIEPALRDYFSKFPKLIEVEHSIASSSEIAIPFYNEFTYGAVDARLTNKDGVGVAGGGSDFLYRAAYSNTSNRSNYGRKGYNPNFLTQANATAQQVLRSNAKMNESIKIRIDYVNKQLAVFSNRSGKLLVVWALFSNNFSDVKYNYIEDVLNLCRGYMLEHAGTTMNLFQNSDLPVSINADFLKSESERLLGDVKEKWEQIPGMSLISN